MRWWAPAGGRTRWRLCMFSLSQSRYIKEKINKYVNLGTIWIGARQICRPINDVGYWVTARALDVAGKTAKMPHKSFWGGLGLTENLIRLIMIYIIIQRDFVEQEEEEQRCTLFLYRHNPSLIINHHAARAAVLLLYNRRHALPAIMRKRLRAEREREMKTWLGFHIFGVAANCFSIEV